jgi:two-component system phosphate regulon sensor histidine kinase PhoR
MTVFGNKTATIWSAAAAVAMAIGVSAIPLPWVAGLPTSLRIVISLSAVALMAGAMGLVAAWRWRDEHTVRRYVDLLCRLDYHELTSPDFPNSLPQLGSRNPWRPIYSRICESLVDLSRRLQETEKIRASSEVRIRRLTYDRQQIADILEGLSKPVIAIDHYGEMTLANAAAAELLHIERSAENRRLEQCVANEPLVRILQETQKRRVPAQRVGEIEVPGGEGAPRVFRVVCRSIPSSDGEHGAVAVLTDITDQKAIQRRNAEFVSAVSHEMKTPLAGIKAYVELLADGEAEDDETRDEFLTVINGQADRLQRLIDNLLNLARIEAGVVDVNKQLLSLNDILAEARNVVQPAAERKQITLKTELSPMFLSVYADRDMLLQAAINLLSNAIKYTPECGRVTLRSRMVDNQLVCEVEDTGVGLGPEDCKRVFEKFYRVKKDRNMASGTGLGLPLAKHIVEDVHSGNLTVESELGHGSIFRFLLPCPPREGG